MKANFVAFLYNKFGKGQFSEDFVLKIAPSKLTKPPQRSLVRYLINELYKEGCLEIRPGKHGRILRLTKGALCYMR